MEKIVKRLFITGALLTAAAVSSLSLTTYAVDYTCSPTNGMSCTQDVNGGSNNHLEDTSTFSLTVGSVLQLNNVTGVHIDDASVSSLNVDNLSATVTTNYKTYVIQLSAAQTDLVLQGDATKKIPAMTSTMPASATIGDWGTDSRWGVLNQVDNVYQGVTTTPTTFFRSNTNTDSEGTVTNLQVGIRVSPIQLPGTYGTEVTVTAIAPAPIP